MVFIVTLQMFNFHEIGTPIILQLVFQFDVALTFITSILLFHSSFEALSTVRYENDVLRTFGNININS